MLVSYPSLIFKIFILDLYLHNWIFPFSTCGILHGFLMQAVPQFCMCFLYPSFYIVVGGFFVCFCLFVFCRTFDQILLLWQTPDQPFLLVPKSSEYLPVRWTVHSYHLSLPWSLWRVASSWLRHAWWSFECVVSVGSCGSTWLVCKAFWHST